MYTLGCLSVSIKNNATCVPGRTWELHFSTDMRQAEKNLAMGI